MEEGYKITPEMSKAHPSICLNCEHGRKPWSEELARQGYVGCFKHLHIAANEVMKSQLNLDWEGIPQHIVNNGTFEQAATGWVCQGRPHQQEIGSAFNGILMTIGCRKCKYFIPVAH